MANYQFFRRFSTWYFASVNRQHFREAHAYNIASDFHFILAPLATRAKQLLASANGRGWLWEVLHNFAVNLNLTTGRMPNVCVVPGCKNNSYKPECQGMSFYILPVDNPHLISEWLIKMHLNKDSVNEHSRICSVHFIDGKKRGKNDIPKLFPLNTRRRKSPKPRSSVQPVVTKKPWLKKGKSLHRITFLAHMCSRSSSWLTVSLNCYQYMYRYEAIQ